MTSRTELDGELVVAEHWPIDGPYRAHDLAEALLAVEYLLRYANHATLEAAERVVPTPEHASILARHLGDALAKLPQLCTQLASRAEDFAADAHLRADAAAQHPPAVQAQRAVTALTELAATSTGLRERAQAAASPLNTLYISEDTE
ncbi:hypothetical protein [Nocardia brasiliensis]|uniref:hypothetical protein n=1 Tax=Nocardia brasiliensis TaxID=37326 RepID=UPI002458FE7B|nr:hypothetical protein [Nocardia brasiliensis]